jgi:hypothetical protein
MGWIHQGLSVATPGAASADSYHFEVEAPPGLEISRARLDAGFRVPKRSSLPEAYRRSRRYAELWLRIFMANERLSVQVDGPVRRVHLLTPALPSKAKPTAKILIRTSRAGFLRPALLTCLLSTTLLWLGYLRVSHLVAQGATASSIPVLLVVPGLLAAYLARPAEHPLATSLLVGVRAMVAVAGLCAVGAAALLIGQLNPGVTRSAWVVLACGASASTVAVLLANLLPLVRTDAVES